MSMEPNDDGGSLKRLALVILKDHASADDAVQEAWLASLERSEAEVQSSGGWLRSVTRNQAVRELERRRRRADIEEQASPPAPQPPPTALLERDEIRARIVAALEDLESPYREVLRARFLDQEPVREIAQASGKPEHTVRTQIRRGLDKLRSRLEPEFGGSQMLGFALVSGFDWHESEVHGAGGAAAASAGGLGLLSWATASSVALLGVAAAAVLVWQLRGEPRPEDSIAPASPVGREAQDLTGTVAAAGAESTASPRRSPLTTAASSAGIPEDNVSESTAPTATIEEATRGVVTVSVTDADARPIPLAEVCLVFHEVVTPVGATDPNGTFQLELTDASFGHATSVPRGEPAANIMIRAKSWATSAIHLVRSNRPIPASVDFTLLAGRELHGQVIDANGIGVAGATVDAVDGDQVRQLEGDRLPPLVRTTTDGNGRFHFDGLVADKQTVQAKKEGFSPGRTLIAGVEDSSECVIRLVSGVRVSGTIRGTDGRPIEGARIRVEPGAGQGEPAPPAISDAAGAYTLNGVPSGGCMLLAVADPSTENGPTQAARLRVDESEGARVEWSPTLEKMSGVRVELTGAEGRDVEGLAVLLRNESGAYQRRVRVGPTGVAVFPLAPSETLQLTIMDHERGLVIETRLLKMPTDEAVRITVPAHVRGARVTGVLASSGGAPIAPTEAVMYFSGAKTRAATPASTNSADGAFELPSLAPDTYTVVLQHSTFGRALLTTFEAESGAQIDLGELRAPQPAEVKILWNFPEDDPSVGFHMRQVLTLSRGRRAGLTLDEGMGAPKDSYLLYPGADALLVVDRDGSTETFQGVELTDSLPRTIEVGPGRQQHMRFDLAERWHGKSVRVAVYDVSERADGLEPEEVEALTFDPGALGDPKQERTLGPDSDNATRLTLSLPVGAWHVRATADSGELWTWTERLRETAYYPPYTMDPKAAGED